MKKNKLVIALLLIALQASEYLPDIEIPELKAEHAAGGAAALAVAGTGLYAYHRAYVAPDLKTIDEAIKFIKGLYDDPFQWYTSKAGTPEFTKIDDFLKQQREIVLRALGISQSFANPKTYSTYRYFSSKPQETLKQIDELFAKLNTVIKKRIRELEDEFDLRRDIKNKTADIYFDLLQKRNTFDDQTLSNTIKKILEDKNNINQTLFINIDEKTQSLAGKILYFIQTPNAFYCDQQACTFEDAKNLQADIDQYKKDLLKLAPSNWFWQSPEQTKFTNGINTLFDLIKNNIYDARPAATNLIRQNALECLSLLVNQMSIDDQWTIVKNSIKKESSPIITHKETPRVSLHHQPTKSPIALIQQEKEEEEEEEEEKIAPNPTASSAFLAYLKDFENNPWASETPVSSIPAVKIAQKTQEQIGSCI